MVRLDDSQARRHRQMKKRILVVDKPRFGDVISRMLGEHYEQDFASDAFTAVGKLRSTVPDAIVADMDVPGSGLRLAELVGMSPALSNIPVILTSSRPSEDRVLKARKAGASSYLAKPFGPGALSEKIKTVMSSETTLEQMGGSEYILDEVSEIDGLPSFPDSYAKILELTEDPRASSEEIAEKIELDPTLLAAVLKLANSACFGFRNRIDSIRMAVPLLGLEEIAGLVASVQVFECLTGGKTAGGLDVNAFWKHSVGTAFVTRGLAKWMQMDGESAYLSGLLHDVGKVVLDQHFTDFYAPVVDRIDEGGIRPVDAEQAMLGLTHADVGGRLSVLWKLPEVIQDCIMYHHKPWHTCRYGRMVCLVHLADALCHRLGYGDGESPELDESVIKRFNIGGKYLEGLLVSAQRELARAEMFLTDLKEEPLADVDDVLAL